MQQIIDIGNFIFKAVLQLMLSPSLLRSEQTENPGPISQQKLYDIISIASAYVVDPLTNFMVEEYYGQRAPRTAINYTADGIAFVLETIRKSFYDQPENKYIGAAILAAENLVTVLASWINNHKAYKDRVSAAQDLRKRIKRLSEKYPAIKTFLTEENINLD